MPTSVILLIEPNKVFAQTYMQALSAAGYKINLATSAQAAITSAEEERPNLVLLELELARHNGIEFLYEFRSYSDWQKTPVIINSNVKPEKFISSSKQLKLLGVDKYLYKPRTSLNELIASVVSELKYAAISN